MSSVAPTPDDARPEQWWRRRVAPLAGMAMLLSGGALAVRVTAMMVLQEQPRALWLFTAAACILAGVALVLIALPAIQRFDDRLPDGASGATSEPPAVYSP